MEILNRDQKSSLNSEFSSFCLPSEVLEIAVIEDNKLINMLFSKTLHSTFVRIRNLKKFPVKFSSFKSGAHFLEYLEKSDFGTTKLIVFSDNYLVNEQNGTEILEAIKRKNIDTTTIVMSETANKQNSMNTINMGERGLIPGKRRISGLPSQKVNELI